MRNPLGCMKIRTHQSNAYRPLTNTFGRVRVQNTRAHQGWDLEAQSGAAVYAITNGSAETLPYHHDWGNRVRLEFLHNGRTYYAFYAHLSSTTVQGPSSVSEGTVLGYTGMSGNAAGLPQREAHLHFGISTNPNPGRGLADYIDPGQLLGFEVYSSKV